MDYFLTEEQQMIVDIARQITEERIIPKRAELDEMHEFPRSILNEMAQADLFGVPIPEEYGGFGGGCFDIVLALEQLGRGCIGVGTAFAASSLGIYPIMISGSGEMKEKYLPAVASGERTIGKGPAGTSSSEPLAWRDRARSITERPARAASDRDAPAAQPPPGRRPIRTRRSPAVTWHCRLTPRLLKTATLPAFQ